MRVLCENAPYVMCRIKPFLHGSALMWWRKRPTSHHPEVPLVGAPL